MRANKGNNETFTVTTRTTTTASRQKGSDTHRKVGVAFLRAACLYQLQDRAPRPSVTNRHSRHRYHQPRIQPPDIYFFVSTKEGHFFTKSLTRSEQIGNKQWEVRTFNRGGEAVHNVSQTHVVKSDHLMLVFVDFSWEANNQIMCTRHLAQANRSAETA